MNEENDGALNLSNVARNLTELNVTLCNMVYLVRELRSLMGFTDDRAMPDMIKHKKIFIIPLLLAVLGVGIFIFSAGAQAATYYVCNLGADCAAGNPAGGWTDGLDSRTVLQAQSRTTPWKTIQKCADTVVAGDTCIVGDGTYTDTNNDKAVVRIARGGSSGSLGNDQYGHQIYDPAKWISFESENQWGAKIYGNNYVTHHGFQHVTGSKYVRIRGFDIYQTAYNGVQSNATNNNNVRIERNKFHDIGRVESGDDPGEGGGRSGSYTGYNCSPAPCTTYWTFDSNHFYNIGRLNPYTTPSAPASTCGTHCYQHDHGLYMTGDYYVVINNLFYGDFSSGHQIRPAGPESYGGGFANNIYIVNNTLIGDNPMQPGCMRIWGNRFGGPDMYRIENNIFSNCSRAAINNYSGKPTDIIVRNNLTNSGVMVLNTEYMPGYGSLDGYLIENNRLNTNPMFTDTGSFDFTLKGDSLAINAGLATNATPYDILGTLRDSLPDIGAHEFLESIYNPADINSDGEVNSADVQLCVNIILEVATVPPIEPAVIVKAKAVAEPLDICDSLDLQAILNEMLAQ